jgi:gamma-glutamylcyclotransferase (GGCT)/AIG2-like uncharacterized protein YtfP
MITTLIRPSGDAILEYAPDMLIGIPDFPKASVFVYGTLQPPYGLYRVIEPYVMAWLPDMYIDGYEMYATAYPWAVPSEDPNSKVWGTLLYLNSEKAFERMDNIELGAGYTRRTVRARNNIVSAPTQAYIYEKHMNKDYLVPSGDYLVFRGHRSVN